MIPFAIFAFGLLARLWLIHAYPLIFGGDSVTRLVFRDRILIAYQLPALQASLWGVARLSDDPLLARCWMAFLGAVAGAGFYYLASDLLGRKSGAAAALLFASNPFLLAHSTVPYQEILMLGALAFAFHFYFVRNLTAASLFLGLACLTRYEAWCAVPVLAAAYLRDRGWTTRAAGAALPLFGWAPAAWILYNGGLAPGGTYVVESGVSLTRLMRYAYIGWITVKFTPVIVLLLAAIGTWRLWKQGLWRASRFQALAAFLAVFLVSILFSAHGVDPDPERFVTAREAHIPIAAAALLAGLGLQRVQRLRWLVLVAAAGLGLWGSARFVADHTSDPHLRLAYEVARDLDRRLGPQETALLLVRPVPEEGVRTYLDRIRRIGGEEAVRRAWDVLESVASTGPDHSRTLVHSRVAKSRIWALVSRHMSPRTREAQRNRHPDWIVVWSDFTVIDPDEACFFDLARASGPPVSTLRSDGLFATVHRISK